MKKILPLLFCFLLAGIACYPILFLLTGSLMAEPELSSLLGPVLKGSKGYASFRLLPMTPTLKHYAGLLLDSPEFFVMFWNSVRLTAGILAGQVLVGVPASWGFAKYRFPLKKAIFTLYILLMMMPFQVTMLSNYLVLDRLHLLNTHAGIILPAAFSTFPVFIMYRFFCGVPGPILEAAQIDGAGPLQIFLHIGLPLGSAGVVSAVVLSFLEYWNLIEQLLTFLQDKRLWPLSLYLPNISLDRAGIAFTASVTALLPAVLIFLSGQDYLEQGIIASAIKE